MVNLSDICGVLYQNKAEKYSISLAFIIGTLINVSNTVLELTQTLDLLYFAILHSVEW